MDRKPGTIRERAYCRQYCFYFYLLMNYFLSSPSSTSATHTPGYKVATGRDLEGASEGNPDPSFVQQNDTAVVPRGPRDDLTTGPRAPSGPRGAGCGQRPQLRAGAAHQSRSGPAHPLREGRSPQSDAREGGRKCESSGAWDPLPLTAHRTYHGLSWGSLGAPAGTG